MVEAGVKEEVDNKEDMMAKKKVVLEKVTPKILIGVPILAWSHEFAESFLKLWTDLMTFNHEGRKFHVGYKFMYRMPVHKAEEQLADLAVASGCTHLLLMDDDIYDVSAQDVITLLDADKDVVAGIMHASGFPYAMCAFRRYDPDTKVADQPILKGPARLYEVPPQQRVGLQKVDLVPFGCTMIKTSAFMKLKKPWFSSDNQAPTDSWFADSALSAGLEYYAHFGVWLNHRGVTRETQPYWAQMGIVKAKMANKDGLVSLTPEEMRRHEAYMTHKLAIAEQKINAVKMDDVLFQEKKKGDGIAKPIKAKRKKKAPVGKR